MSLESVRAFLQANAPDIELIETDDSSSTVEPAAKAHGIEPAQIAKTICLRGGYKTLLIVASGIARLDNRKVKRCAGREGSNARSKAGSYRHRPFRWWRLMRYFAAALQRSCARRRFGQCSA
jgi:prolyl-tRNA editing enzyme YbaK/EbsC (Cys-tRNA(Pro) deacylase)